MRIVTTSASARIDRGLVVFGEFFIDLIFHNLSGIPQVGEEVRTKTHARFPGGGLATTALVAANLGTPTGVITRVGKDANASPEWQKIKAANISVRACEFDRHWPTAITVCIAFAGDRMMITHDPINNDLRSLFTKRTAQKEMGSARHLHLACALRLPHLWVPALRKLRKQGLTISADVGWNPAVIKSPRLPQLLKELEFMFPNEVEVLAMTGEITVEAAITKLARWVRVPVVKLGPDGALAVRDGKMLRVKSLKVRSVDATGSGDAFNGGFLHGYLAGWSLEECLRAGSVCGALATTSAGGSSALPTPQQLKKLTRKLTRESSRRNRTQPMTRLPN